MANLTTRLQKLLSRKFLVSVAGVISGIALIANGNTLEGTSAIIASVVGYLAAEGYIDAKAVADALDNIEEKNNGNT